MKRIRSSSFVKNKKQFLIRSIRSTRFLSLLVVIAPANALAQIPQAEYAARRAALAKIIGNGIVVAFGSNEPQEDYIAFNQNSPFSYLTGFNEPGAGLVFQVRNGEIAGRPKLFARSSNPEREVWTGARLGLPGIERTLGLEGRESATLLRVLDSLLTVDSTTILNIVGDFALGRQAQTETDQRIAALTKRHPRVVARNLTAAVAELRRIKSAAELDLIRKAVAITVDAQREAMRFIEPGQNEFEVQALIEYTFRRNG
ncbi:MAG TPA: aminopeptidase P N-terminal domain-containing protein, partial [Gemmatimonadaceae bacterium]|nr:aminopeptidase P N-terminal domain-containing protein [Gemmatimonadaceae bacterium]